MKCTNCGIEIPNLSKFCQECGTLIPLEKVCPNCGIKLPFGTKFCIECGTSFVDNPRKTSDELNLGDKNVIAGDVLGSKNDYNISGNTIIYKNEDETKKVLSCSICGKHVSNSQGHTCPKCGKFVCSDHFNSETNQCIICTKNELSAVESEYIEALEQVYADGIVDIEERKKLSMLKEKIGLSEQKASELESRFSNSMADNSTELTRSEKIILNDARNMVLYQFKLQEAVTLLSKIREEHEYDELSLKLYLYAITEYHKENALVYLDAILESYNICAAYICKIDVLLKIGKLNEAEKLLNLAKKYYGGDSLLLAKEIEVLCSLYKSHSLESLKEEIQSLTSSLPEGASEWEKAGIMFTKALVAKTFGDNDTFQKIAANYTIETGNISFFFERIKENNPEVTNEKDESVLESKTSTNTSESIEEKDIEFQIQENNKTTVDILQIPDTAVALIRRTPEPIFFKSVQQGIDKCRKNETLEIVKSITVEGSISIFSKKNITIKGTPNIIISGILSNSKDSTFNLQNSSDIIFEGLNITGKQKNKQRSRKGTLFNLLSNKNIVFNECKFFESCVDKCIDITSSDVTFSKCTFEKSVDAYYAICSAEHFSSGNHILKLYDTKSELDVIIARNLGYNSKQVFIDNCEISLINNYDADLSVSNSTVGRFILTGGNTRITDTQIGGDGLCAIRYLDPPPPYKGIALIENSKIFNCKTGIDAGRGEKRVSIKNVTFENITRKKYTSNVVILATEKKNVTSGSCYNQE